MDLIETKTDLALLRSLLAEVAKAQNEITQARLDIDKAQSRIRFSLLIINKLIDRKVD
jgi:poly(3-hydroxyalkanoate) synthetase